MVETYGKKYDFAVMEASISAGPIAAGHVILSYTQQYSLDIHHGSVTLYDVW